MAITVYNPEGIETVANSRFVMVPSGAVLDALTIAEIDAGTEFTCALTEFESGADSSENEDKRICRRDAGKRAGSVTYSINDFPIIQTDPQEEDPFIDGLVSGVQRIIVEFPNITPGTATAAGQKYYAWKSTLKSRVPGKISTDDGELFAQTTSWSVQERTLSGAVAAGA